MWITEAVKYSSEDTGIYFHVNNNYVATFLRAFNREVYSPYMNPRESKTRLSNMQ